MVPALRLFTELKVADPKGWVPVRCFQGHPHQQAVRVLRAHVELLHQGADRMA